MSSSDHLLRASNILAGWFTCKTHVARTRIMLALGSSPSRTDRKVLPTPRKRERSSNAVASARRQPTNHCGGVILARQAARRRRKRAVERACRIRRRGAILRGDLAGISPLSAIRRLAPFSICLLLCQETFRNGYKPPVRGRCRMGSLSLAYLGAPPLMTFAQHRGSLTRTKMAQYLWPGRTGSSPGPVDSG